MTEISDDALVFGFSYFPSMGSTLSFGGDHAKMEITPRARDALEELLSEGYVEACEPLDQWPNREHYRCVNPISHLRKDRPHLNPFSGPTDAFNWSMFVKKGSDDVV